MRADDPRRRPARRIEPALLLDLESLLRVRAFETERVGTGLRSARAVQYLSELIF